MRILQSVLIVLVMFLVVVIFLTFIHHVNDLEEENKFLKEENHMLKNALADLGAEIEGLSIMIDKLEQERNRGNTWNEEAIPEYRR